MFRADVLVGEAFGLLGGVGEERLHSLERGRSTEVETFSRMVVWPSICWRMDSTEACERRKRLVSALSSRSRPSNRCSVSMYGEPNWLAS
jgi:hypothetical protein